MRRSEGVVTLEWCPCYPTISALAGFIDSRDVSMTLPSIVTRLRDCLEPLPESPPAAVNDTTLACVLAPLFIDESGEIGIWLVKKSAALRRHGGQVALPGGKVDPEDSSLLATALRETHEEIGIASPSIRVLGALPSFPTSTGFFVIPFVGFLPEPVELTPDQSEITRVFRAPLLPFAAVGEQREVKVQSWAWRVPSYAIEGEIVWGATAAILHELASRLVRSSQ
jgi:8-oxo-dGTP pyrophosphatase MutT (NUDIX family)